MKQSITARELRTRLGRLYRESGSATTLPVWFAGVARVTPWAVTRWLDGRRAFRGPALALLELLETAHLEKLSHTAKVSE